MEGKLTQGEKKILLKFQRFVENDTFIDEVKRVRKALDIPSTGYPLSKKELEEIEKHIKVPDSSEYNYVLQSFRWECTSKYPEEVKRLLEMFPIMSSYYSLLIRNYIYYNTFFYDEFLNYRNASFGICEILDAEEESEYLLIDEDPENTFSTRGHNDKIVEKIYKYPVSIRIHSDASQNDVIDYIKKNWKIIKEYQSKYVNNKGLYSIRNSKTKENKELKKRNEFIYKHKHLPRKEIMAMVNKDFRADLDQGSIGKIISLERKKREKK